MKILRVFVALLALGGGCGAIIAGFVIQETLTQHERTICARLGVASMADALKLSEAVMASRMLSAQQTQEFNNALDVYRRASQGIWFLYAAGGLGLCGMFLGLYGKSKCAAAALLTAAVGPAVIMPPAGLPALAIFIGALPTAGLLALVLAADTPSPRPWQSED